MTADIVALCRQYSKDVEERAAMFNARRAKRQAACDKCHGTGWIEASDVYPDGSYTIGRPCPRGCKNE